MGCVASRIDKEGRVQVCKERKKLMKQLVGYRGEFADAQLAYLRAGDSSKGEAAQEESIEINQDDCSTSPPPTPSSSWNYWDLFEYTSALHHPKGSETIESVEEENWAESKMEFEDEVQGEELVENAAISPLPEKPRPGEIVDDNSSMMSWYKNDSADVAMVVWKNKKTLEGIIKELDDYFLKASAGGKEIAVFTDINIAANSLPWKLNENKRKRSNSAKFFSALSWGWSSKSIQFERDDIQCGSSEPCKPGAHCITLDKLYVAEQKLYKEVKEEEITKLELERKLLLLQKQDENHDWTKTEKTRSIVENLETDIRRLQHSIIQFPSEIVRKPSVVFNGKIESWFISMYRMSFFKLIKSQQEYVRTLCRWIQLTDCLVDYHQQNRCSSAVRRLCKEWRLGFEKLPDTVASEATKSFLLAIHSIIRQQVDRSIAASDVNSTMSPKHPLLVKRAKTEALKKRVDMEKGKHLNSVLVRKTMILNNLKTSLPNVFQALMRFTKASAQAFEAIHDHAHPEIPCNESENSTKYD
ncbi:hypothetical protein CRYUN_Cryun10bG0167600 [Craigia yunnanensis]